MKKPFNLITGIAAIATLLGCCTTPIYPNADLNAFESRARAAIAEMPVCSYRTTEVLPESHPWHAPLKDQNLRIARASANFSANFSRLHNDRIILRLHFRDPTELEPSRCVSFDYESGKLLGVQYPRYSNCFGDIRFVTDGRAVLNDTRLRESVVAVGMAYSEVKRVLLAWGAREISQASLDPKQHLFDLPHQRGVLAITIDENIVQTLAISDYPGQSGQQSRQIETLDLRQQERAEQNDALDEVNRALRGSLRK